MQISSFWAQVKPTTCLVIFKDNAWMSWLGSVPGFAPLPPRSVLQGISTAIALQCLDLPLISNRIYPKLCHLPWGPVCLSVYLKQNFLNLFSIPAFFLEQTNTICHLQKTTKVSLFLNICLGIESRGSSLAILPETQIHHNPFNYQKG